MQRKFIFKSGNREILLPITPPSFTISHGTNIETINIHTLGDVNIAGYGTLASININCEFPSKKYPFAFSSGDPYELVNTFKEIIKEKKTVRFIISGTPINMAVLIQSIDYSEQDGTKDVYVTITLREYREIAVTKVEQLEVQNKSRAEPESPPVKSSTYIIVRGDTLSGICRKFYGDASLYPKLAAVNNIKNPNLIYTGNILKIPDKNQL